MKKTIALLLIFVLILGLASCAKQESTAVNVAVLKGPTGMGMAKLMEDTAAGRTANAYSFAKQETTAINVAVLKGPTGMGMAKLMEDAAAGKTANAYSFTVSSDTADVMAKVIAGEYDIAALPTNNAAMAYNKTGGEVQIAAINTLGTLYLLQNTEIESPMPTCIEDLKYATIVTFGQGANPEYVLTRILEKAGLTVGTDVTIEFKGSVDEVLALVAAGEADYVMVPEPNATVVQVKNSAYQVALDLNNVWESQEGTLVMGCVVTTKKFADAHPDAVRKFLEEYEASIAFAQDKLDEAAALCAKHEIVASEAIAKKSLPNCHLTFVSGKQMQPTLKSYYETLFGYNPAAIGGKLPDEGFYFE